jgi:hypothetical protein
MSVPQPQSFGSPAFVAVPAARAYRIINVRVPVDLAPILANQADDDRLVTCEIVVEGTRISKLGPVGAIPLAADLPTIDLRGGIALPQKSFASQLR